LHVSESHRVDLKSLLLLLFALQQQQQQQIEYAAHLVPQGGNSAATQQQQQQQHCPSASEGNSSRRSSASGAAPSDDDEVAQHQQQQQQLEQVSPRQRDKEWAALTTWLRMNLHHVSGGDCSVAVEIKACIPWCCDFSLVDHCSHRVPSCGCLLSYIDWPIALRYTLAFSPDLVVDFLLLQPRTAKKLVLFVGQQDAATG
jgi:hypothetical protein